MRTLRLVIMALLGVVSVKAVPYASIAASTSQFLVDYNLTTGPMNSVKLHEIFSITADVLINATHPVDVKIEILKPGYWYEVCSNVDVYTNGTSVSSSCSQQFASYITTVAGHTATVDNSHAAIHPTVSPPLVTYLDDRIRAEVSLPGNNQLYPISFAVSANQTAAVCPITLIASILISNPGPMNENITATATYNLTGPDLVVNVSSVPKADLTPGDNVTFTVTVQHSDCSSEDAANITLMTQPETTVGTFVLNSGDILQGGVTTQNLDPARMTIASLSLGSSAVFTFRVQIGSDLPVNVGYTHLLNLKYYSSDAGNTQQYKGDTVRAKVPAVEMDLSSMPGDIGLPSDLHPGVTYNLVKNMVMPRGKLELSGYVAFSSSSLPSLDITFGTVEVTMPSSVSYTRVGSSLYSSNATSKTFGIASNARKRRALLQTNSQNLGTLQNNGNSAPITVVAPFTVNAGTVSGGPVSSSSSVGINSLQFVWSQNVGTLYRPMLSINKTAEVYDATVYPNKIRINVTVEHEAQSAHSAYSVSLKDGSSILDILWYENRVGPALSSLVVVGDTVWTWNKSPLGTTESMFMSVICQPSGTGGTNLPAGKSSYTATVTYKPNTQSNAATFTESSSVCLERDEYTNSNVFYDYGFTVLCLLLGFIIAVVIVIVVILIVVKVCKKPLPFSKITPGGGGTGYVSKQDAHVTYASQMVGQNRGLIMEKGSKKKRTKPEKSIKELSKFDTKDSIVSALVLKNPTQVNKELDSQDIVGTTTIDKNLEDERLQAMVNSTVQVLNNLSKNGDLPSGIASDIISKFRRKINNYDNLSAKDYEQDLEKLYDSISKKNKMKLSDLLSAQGEEMDVAEKKLQNAPKETKEEMLKLLKNKHAIEQDDLTYKLKLEQEEEQEKLRKEHTARKELAVRDMQKEALDEAKTDGKLLDEQVTWLMTEHTKNQTAINKLYDDEQYRQRMLLEEKLAQRKALAAAKEAQEEQNDEVLDTIAEQQLAAIKKMRKDGTLTKEEANKMIEDSRDQMMATKQRMDAEKQQKELELMRKLSERKAKRLAEQEKEIQNEKKDYDKQEASTKSDAFTEPMALIEGKCAMNSEHNTRLAALEMELDKEDAKELAELQDEIADKTRIELEKDKEKMMDKLVDQGLSEDQMDKLLNKHSKEVANLKEQHEQQRLQQEKSLKDRLKEQRAERAKRLATDKVKQEELRERKEKIIRNALDNQVAISEDERMKIIKAHEKDMAKMEESLTMSKLQQRRILEEKMAKRRAKRMEDIQKEQQKEQKMHARKSARSRHEDEDDEDIKLQKELALMKRHAEDRLALLQDEDTTEEESESISQAMVAEREAAMAEQEVRLSAMLTKLQMDKAKEVAEIEAQQKAILNLKSNLMDDLNEKGILSDPDCQKVLEIHHQEQEKLNNKLSEQRQRQEQALRARLDAQLKKKQSRLQGMQEQQLSAVGAPSNPVVKIKRAMLNLKHQREMQEFQDRMEREMTQALEDMKRSSEIRRGKLIQEQEVQFLNGLVRLGKFDIEELDNVIQMLFPLKLEDEKKALMDQLTEGYVPEKKTVKSVSTLARRVKSSLRRGNGTVDHRQNPKKKKVPTATLR